MGAFRHPLPQPCANGRAYNHFYLHRALLDVTIRLPTTHGTLRVLNAHLEAFDVANRMIHAEKTQQLAQLAINARQTPLLLLGDMNSVPDEATMRHAFPDEPQTDMRADTSINIIRNVAGLNQAGQHIDSPEQWSFPAENPNRRLDYIFVAGLSVSDSRVLQLAQPASDHLPVVTTAQIP